MVGICIWTGELLWRLGEWYDLFVEKSIDVEDFPPLPIIIHQPCSGPRSAHPACILWGNESNPRLSFFFFFFFFFFFCFSSIIIFFPSYHSLLLQLLVPPPQLIPFLYTII
ncbi:hypothetical protein P175DRAFT_0290598 [Aspergillus ochraceoroseus IBT 24754]|uniref:Uncharacterized protein n=1 Tax=Aspergillus ochraceoroseus IBT 24754 TaxID=1392256 RepID=A0A2T5LSD5_9EURO|nr:uncharacterized protein P175DRAFT_0290598 [Aspergillus ochraceoroseus IBT 24754]PTU19186.1 hypothetical protein P175DRAFT_0290598 [Aspergillus ochraceoroseus IBT 24754]